MSEQGSFLGDAEPSACAACDNCREAVRQSKDVKLTRWLESRGLAFCRVYSKLLSRKFLTTLINAWGMVCSGRDYVPQEEKSAVGHG